MSIVHWLLLIIVIVVVGGAYWYLRRHNGGDPWQGMEETGHADTDTDNGVSLNGDSYIVGVRTLTPDSTATAAGGSADATAGDQQTARSEAEAEAAWAAYKKQPGTSEMPTPEQQAPAHPGTAAQTSATEPAASEPQRPSAAARVENIRPVRPPAGEERIFVLHVTRSDEQHFDGPDIHAALDAEGLKFGLNDFYHRITDANGEIESVYCVANMLKPGVLDPVDQDHLSTPGLTLFLVLPGAIEGVRAMRDMMETANGIAQRLGGQVLDDKRSLLKAQTAQYMLDQIAEIDRRARLQNAR